MTPETLHVRLDSWIIQDGNYTDFQVGESRKFALEFYPFTIKSSNKESISFEHLFGSRYRVTSQVVFATHQVWVANFGFMAYREQPPPQLAVQGAWLEMEIDIGIDPFFYFERLHSLTGMPCLFYNFNIREILLETTPWLASVDKLGRTVLKRDDVRLTFVPVVATDAWHDDEGRANYILACDQTG